ncbi:MAG: response regulator transcription factor [Coriobacteriales bacterium]|nr:response regulator transcription factor [Coriobacteriales bacterium]
MSNLIYYVEDDLNIRNLTMYALQQTGLEIQGFSTAAELDRSCEAALPDLFILDIMLPDEDGISILKRLRGDAATADIPVIMLTAKGTEFDVVSGLDSGADDYLSKPFSMMELVSRVKAQLRRRTGDAEGNAHTTTRTLGHVTLSPKQHSVEVDGNEVTLANKEFELLHLLMQSPGQVFTREQILEAIWGWSYAGNTRTVDVHIQTLRHKLGSSAELIETIRSVGYRARVKT